MKPGILTATESNSPSRLASAQRIAPRAVQAVALTLIALTPIFNIGEVGSLLLPSLFRPVFGAPATYDVMMTPLWIKAIKDVGMWALLALSLLIPPAVRAAKLGAHVRLVRLIVGAIVLAGAASARGTAHAAPSLREGVLAVYAGARWLLPVVLAFTLIGATDGAFAQRVGIALVCLLFANVGLQAYQSLAGLSVLGVGPLGMALRPSGFFFIPSTAAAFACVVAFWAHCYLPRGAARLAAQVVAPVSIVLAASATGVAAYLLTMFVLVFPGRWLRARALAFPLVLVAIALNLNALSTRTDIYSYSAPVRAQLFASAVANSGVVSSAFGLGTNGGKLLGGALGADAQTAVLDSFYTSVIYNVGWLGAVAFAAAFGLVWFACLRTRAQPPIAFAVLFSVLGLGVSFSEAFPVNLVFAIWLATNLPTLVRPRAVNPAYSAPPT